MQKIVEKYFDISHDASATLIVTLLIFFLGYIFTGTFYILSRYFNRRSNRKIFFSSLDSLTKTLKTQENAFLETIDSMNFEENTIWSYLKVDYFQLLTFREFGYKETFKSFFYGFENQTPTCTKKRFKRKCFNKAWSIFNNIEFWSSKSLNDFYSFLDKYNTFGDKRNNAVSELRKMWEQLFSVNPEEITQEHHEYLNKLSSIIVEFSRIPTLKRVGPYITNRKLILQIRILNKKYRILPFVQQFNDKCMEASSAYIDMEYLIRNVKKQYKSYFYSFREFRRSIIIIKKVLR